MAASEEKSNDTGPAVHAAESQGQRWLKYGANVLLTSLVVIALAVLLTWLAESHAFRHDTTIGGTQSLRPQTVNFLNDFKQKARIVALYPKLKSESREQDFYQPVADLLTEYSTKNHNITTEMLDPDTQKDELNKLVAEVTNKYGGEVKGYKAILDDLPAQDQAVDKFAKEEGGRFRALPFQMVQDQQLMQQISAAFLRLLAMQQQIGDLKNALDSELTQPVPSYKDCIDDAKSAYTSLSQFLQEFTQLAGGFAGNNAFPKPIRDYAVAAGSRAAGVKKAVDAILDRINHLGAIKELNEFKNQLTSKSIIVMMDSGYKILPDAQIWRKAPDTDRFISTNSDVESKLSFAGEQEITAALYLLSSGHKPLVVFVRPGGPPLASSPTGERTYFGAVAQRLRDYNFDVMEKSASPDMSEQEMPAPEPTDEQMKSAIWVVLRAQHDTQPQERSPLNAMLDDHLKSGGSAMVLLFPGADPMDEALLPWGVKADSTFLLVHEARTAPERRATDIVEMLRANQLAFILNNYGDHPIAKPLQGLDFLMAVSSPIEIEKPLPPDETAAPLLPIPRPPQGPHSWACPESQGLTSFEQGRTLTFHPTANPDNGIPIADMDNTDATPLYGAAAAQRTDGARLVVVGSYVFANPDWVELVDQEMKEQHGLNISRLPGNGEFFVDSVFWLAHMDSMLAISPHALQMARIEQMTSKKLMFWRLGVLTAGLPLAVVVAGLLVYARRRD